MGGPCSGKTTRAQELQRYFINLGLRVVMAGEDQLGWDKRDLHYNEGTRRALLENIRGIVEQSAGDKGCVTIIDTMLCSRRDSSQTRRNLLAMTTDIMQWKACVLYCNTPVEVASEWNKLPSRGKKRKPYSTEMFQSIACVEGAVEVPNKLKHPWDNPTCAVTPDMTLPFKFIEHYLLDEESIPDAMSFKNGTVNPFLVSPTWKVMNKESLQADFQEEEKPRLSKAMQRQNSYLDARKKELQNGWGPPGMSMLCSCERRPAYHHTAQISEKATYDNVDDGYKAPTKHVSESLTGNKNMNLRRLLDGPNHEADRGDGRQQSITTGVEEVKTDSDGDYHGKLPGASQKGKYSRDSECCEQSGLSTGPKYSLSDEEYIDMPSDGEKKSHQESPKNRIQLRERQVHSRRDRKLSAIPDRDPNSTAHSAKSTPSFVSPIGTVAREKSPLRKHLTLEKGASVALRLRPMYQT